MAYDTGPMPYPGVASHIPVLWTILTLRPTSSVFEIGCGEFSSALFATWTEDKAMPLYQGENEDKWRPIPRHSKQYVSSTDDIRICDANEDSLAFIDHEAGARAGAVNRLLDETRCGMVVVHDTEPHLNAAYKVRGPLLRWPYGIQVACPYSGIQTSVVSRVPFEADLATSLRMLNHSYGLHKLRWDMAKIFIVEHQKP